MNKELFRHYIDSFNRDDFAGFSQYYADDVVLELPKKELRGRQAIIDFYKGVKARIRETLKINQVVADEEGLAAEVETEFLALEDWPDFIVAPMKKGDRIRIVSFVHYEIRGGRFAHIKSARFRTLS
jgi:sulfur carrier protein ThiS